MKRLCYSSEDTTKILRIVLPIFLVGAVIFMIIGAVMGDSIDLFTIIFMLIFCMPPIFIFTFLIPYLVTKKERDKMAKIKQFGNKYEGTILGWDAESIDTEGASTNHLYIEYVQPNGEKKTFKTPHLNFFPPSSLGSTKCSVYVFEDQEYATDFVRANSNSEKVFKGKKRGI